MRPEIAERVLGHAIAGVEGVYDRHSYREEKADALNRLAALVGTIIDPPAVVKLGEAAIWIPPYARMVYRAGVEFQQSLADRRAGVVKF